MKNQELARIFYGMAFYLDMESVPFKPYAYEKVALSLEALEDDVEEIYKKGGLKALKKEIPGVGENIARAIEEYLISGKIKNYNQLRKKFPIDVDELIKVQGLGPKKIKVLYQKLKVKNLKDLKKAAKAGKINGIFGFGEKTEKNIIEGVEFLERSKGRFLIGYIIPEVEKIMDKLKGLKEIKKISIAGSVRRMKETIGDVDILAVSKNPGKVMDFFVSLPEVEKVWVKGSTKTSVRMNLGFDPVRSKSPWATADAQAHRTSNGVDMDLRVVPERSYGSALQYFTGSKEHNIITRKIAIGKGLKLNEYGVFKGPKMIAGKTEEDVYKAIGLAWIPPELRENKGEVELALDKKLPELIGYNSIKGDLHCHSNWNGGKNSIEEMAKAAQEMGYEYIGISDHTKFLRIEYGLNERKLLQQRKEIERINSKFESNPLGSSLRVQRNSKFRILQGCETNILSDGSVDIKDDALEKLDYVIAGVHSGMKMERNKMTERIIKAMKNPNIDIISHPTGRVIGKRDEYQVDFDKILMVAKETGTILEINSSPERLDLKDINIKRAKEAGVKMIINTDSHHKDQLGLINYGIAQARRGWAEKEDIINTQSLNNLLNFFK